VIKGCRRPLALALLFVAALQLAACSSAEDRAQSYYKSGTEYVAKGDLVKASLEFRNALKLKANLTDAQFALGDIAERQGNYSDAAKAFNAVAEQDEKSVPARVRLAYILVAAGQIDEAVKKVAEAAAIAPDDPTVLVVQAAIALKQNRHPETIELAKAALKVSPGSPEALMVLASERLSESDPVGALSYLNDAGPGADTNVSLQLLRLVALEASGDDPGVEALFKKMMATFPDNPGFRQGLVRWYLGKNRPDDAEAVIRQTAADNPGDDQAQLLVVAFVNSTRGPAAAIAELQTIVAAREKEKGDTFIFEMAMTQLQFASGDTRTAIDRMAALVSSTADAGKKNEARIQWARMLVAQGEAPEAEKLLDLVVTQDAGNVDALNVRASLRLMRGDNASAIQDLLAALNEAPDNAGTHGLLAEAYERDGSMSLAQEQYAKTMDLGKASPQTGLPYARFLLRMGKSDQAARVLQDVAQRAPGDRDVLSLLGQVKLTTQDWAGAQQVADMLRKLDEGQKDDTIADRINAAALSGLNRFADSISLLQSAVADESQRRQVLPDLVATYVKAGKPDAAVDYLKSVIDQSPGDVQPQLLLGSVYVSMGDTALAEQTFKAAAGLDEGIEGELSLAQFYLANGRLADAETTTKSAIATDDTSTAAHLLLASIYERAEKFDDAISEYEALFQKDPGSAVLANDLASLLSERRGDKAALDRAFDIAQRLKGSEVPQYLDTLGWIYHLRGDDASALPLLKSAAAALPNIALVQYHLGLALNALGQSAQARDSLNKALELTPPLFAADLERAREVLKQIEASVVAPATPAAPAPAGDKQT
jgi:tetratricopeptide (TPR) repeat protein